MNFFLHKFDIIWLIFTLKLLLALAGQTAGSNLLTWAEKKSFFFLFSLAMLGTTASL